MAATRKQHEFLEKLSSDIEKLRECGISYGLPDKDIDLCIHRVFSPQSLLDIHPKPSKCLTKCCIAAVKFIFVSLFICCCGYAIILFHRPSQRLVIKTLEPYSYKFNRFIRLATLPVTRRYDMTDFYESECLIDNPLFSDAGPESCEPCKDVTGVEQMEELSSFSDQFYHTGHIVVVKDAMQYDVTFTMLSTIFKDNRDHVMSGSLFHSTDQRIKTLSDLFDQHNEKSINSRKYLHAQWMTRRLSAAQVIRQLFPRPYFIPDAAEVTMEKTVFIDGVNSQPYTIPNGHFPNVWYAQGSGSRQLFLVPKGYCIRECKQFRVVMEPRSILYYNDAVWRVDSVPGDSDCTGVAFVGSFS